VTDDPYRVMTVCTGNICRSPMAEVVLRARLEDAGFGDRVVVDSTGVSDEEHGNPIDRRARAALASRGYDVPRREARQVRAADLADRDLVLAMTASHARALRRIAGDDEAAGRVVMFRTFDPAAPRVADRADEHLLDVDDPWYGGPENFEHCLDEIEAAADGVVDAVRAALSDRDAARA
jgi:protein-tyrosine phosphatase